MNYCVCQIVTIRAQYLRFHCTDAQHYLWKIRLYWWYHCVVINTIMKSRHCSFLWNM